LHLNSGCILDPVFHPERQFFLKVRLVNEQGRPADRAEVWVDDGRKVSVKQVLGDRYAFRTEDGKWHEYEYARARDLAPGEVPWFEMYRSLEDIPRELRILVVQGGTPVAFVRRPIAPSDSVRHAGHNGVEIVVVRAPLGTTRSKQGPGE